MIPILGRNEIIEFRKKCESTIFEEVWSFEKSCCLGVSYKESPRFLGVQGQSPKTLEFTENEEFNEILEFMENKENKRDPAFAWVPMSFMRVFLIEGY